jgi:hypothetical protein
MLGLRTFPLTTTQETLMKRNKLHDVAFVLALGSATLAWAGSPSSTTDTSGITTGAATTNSTTTDTDANGAAGSMGATDANRLPANRANDATQACANVAASDKEGCMARWNARHNGQSGYDRQNGSGMGAMDRTNPPSTDGQGTPPSSYGTDSVPNGSSTPGTSGK